MKQLQRCRLLVMLIISIVIITACSNTKAEAMQSEDVVPVLQTKGTIQPPAPEANSKLQTELDNAKAAGKAVFVVVTGNGIAETDLAITIANEANDIYKNARVVQMNRDDEANAQLVSEWRLSGAPLPLILVISSKGFPTGGYILSQATAKNVAALVPSPKLEAVYEAIGGGKHAIVVFSRKSIPDRDEAKKIAAEAVSLLNDEAVFIEVNMDDPNETNFMDQLRIDKSSVEASITLVFNKQGQLAGTSTSLPDATKLAAAATSPVKSGCGPGCGPAGCEQ